MKNPLLLYVVFWLWKMANVAIHFKFVRVQEHNYSKFWPFCLCKFPPVKILLFKIISILLLGGSYARRQIFSICIPSEEILIAFHASLPTNQVKSKSLSETFYCQNFCIRRLDLNGSHVDLAALWGVLTDKLEGPWGTIYHRNCVDSRICSASVS